MIKILKIDFETRSEVELSGQKSVGLHNYLTHSSTKILMLAYKLPGSRKVELWEPHLGPMPADLLLALLDPDVFIEAYNSGFERGVLEHLLGITIPTSRFLDPQVGARYLSLPADLETVCYALDLPEGLYKDKRGGELIDLFCVPKKTRKKKGEEQQIYFNDWKSNPNEWAEFGEYCKQDVIAEEEVYRRIEMLEALPLPPFEQKLWIFDQTVNDRGLPVDVDFVQKMLKIAVRAKQESLDAANAITGLENSNSTTQLLPWVRERGYPYNTLNKNFVDAVLKDTEVNITPECRAALKARRESASTSYTKLSAILRQVSNDRRLRYQFIFMGSSRCGRWAGNAVQPHNLARPGVVGKTNENPDGYNFEDMEVVNDARAMIYREDYDALKAKYKEVLLVVKFLIRTVFVAPEVPDAV